MQSVDPTIVKLAKKHANWLINDQHRGVTVGKNGLILPAYAERRRHQVALDGGNCNRILKAPSACT